MKVIGSVKKFYFGKISIRILYSFIYSSRILLFKEMNDRHIE